MITTLLAFLALAIWIYLLFFNGRFWRDERPAPVADPAIWPTVVAVIPARDEAESIAPTVESLLRQDYPGTLTVVLVDDHSSDGTADIAREAARRVGAENRLTIVSAEALPSGWTGKLWAVSQGLAKAAELAPDAGFILLTDADIDHHKTNVRELVARAEAEGRDLVSLMVELNCQTLPERAMIPAFVYFFRMLYPFAKVADDSSKISGAAGGSMLARRSALDRIGGVSSFKDALIDDCALAAAIKKGGSIRLDLAEGTRSLRVYPDLADIRSMIARTAYTQLQYSPVLLAVTVLGLGITFLAPPLLALFAEGLASTLGFIVWGAMSLSYVPMLTRYRRNPFWAPLLPIIAAIYLWATVESAVAYWRGVGGQWKGRAQARQG